MERCLACEADSGRNRHKVLVAGVVVAVPPFLSAFVLRQIETVGGDPFRLASEAALHGVATV